MFHHAGPTAHAVGLGPEQRFSQTRLAEHHAGPTAYAVGLPPEQRCSQTRLAEHHAGPTAHAVGLPRSTVHRLPVQAQGRQAWDTPCSLVRRGWASPERPATPVEALGFLRCQLVATGLNSNPLRKSRGPRNALAAAAPVPVNASRCTSIASDELTRSSFAIPSAA